MPELSIQDIESISLDIRRQEISFSHLPDELIDHICCDVENEMQKGMSFSEAYDIIKMKIGPGRIKEIQKETLYAVDTKYRIMKNIMKISGVAGTIIFGIATLFKIQHWAYAGVLLVLGAFILAFVFMPSVLTVLWKETHNRKKLFLLISGFITGMLFIFGTLFKIQHWPVAGIILSLSVLFAVFLFIPALLFNRLAEDENKHKRPVYIVGAAGCILYVAGTLFKIQHWPMAMVFMILALIILFFVALPWYTWLTWKDDSSVSPAFIFIIIGSLLIIVPGALINLNLRNMYNEGYYPHLLQEEKLFEVSMGMNKSLLTQYHDSLCYNEMELLHAKTQAALTFLEAVKIKLTEEPEEKQDNHPMNAESVSQPGGRFEIQKTILRSPFNRLPARTFLLPGCSVRNELDNVLADYMNYISSLAPDKDPGRFKGLLDPSVYFSGGRSAQPDLTLLSALHTVDVLKNNILAVESCMFKYIAKQK